MRCLIVIPARLASVRLPRKVLLAETGKPLAGHVIDQCQKIRACDQYAPRLACTKDWTFEAHHHFGRLRVAIRETGEHPNGTSRASEVLLQDDNLGNNFAAVCIVQADYPEISPTLIDQVISELERHPEWDCATAAQFPDHKHAEVADDRSKVKVFIPICSSVSGTTAVDFRRDFSEAYPRSNWTIHVGIYCYRREALLRYAAAGPCEREQQESLEQLRALELKMKMGVVLTNHSVSGIDTRADYDAFLARYRQSQLSPT